MKNRVFYFLIVGIISASALISISSIRGNRNDLFYRNAEALSDEEDVHGTCCKQDGAICVVGTFHAENYFYQHYGPCKDL